METELKPVPLSKATNSFELILEAADVIEEDYRRLNMTDWIVYYRNPGLGDEGPDCGCVGCAGGWICLLKGMGRTSRGDDAIHILLGEQYTPYIYDQPPWARKLMDDIFTNDYLLRLPAEDPTTGAIVVERLREFADTYRAQLEAIPQTPGVVVLYES
jgi:hypothetical protein